MARRGSRKVVMRQKRNKANKTDKQKEVRERGKNHNNLEKKEFLGMGSFGGFVEIMHTVYGSD